MGFYEKELQEKTYKDVVEGLDNLVEANFELIPHTDYKANDSYICNGMGKVFDGVYRFKKVEHKISPTGYTVTGTASMTYDVSGTPAKDVEPAPETSPSPEKGSTSGKDEEVYTVKSGDNLWNICSKLCGDGRLYTKIAEVNGIDNASIIIPGQKITIPGKYRK